MALTMTRTRTQTALTQLVETLANLKGELAFVEGWLAEEGAPVELANRREVLLRQLNAVTTTLQVFDPELDAGQVAQADGWTRILGRRGLNAKQMRSRYLRGNSG